MNEPYVPDPRAISAARSFASAFLLHPREIDIIELASAFEMHAAQVAVAETKEEQVDE